MGADPPVSPRDRFVSLAKESTPDAWTDAPVTCDVRNGLPGGFSGLGLQGLSSGVGAYDTAMKYLFLFVIACAGLKNICFFNLIFRSDGLFLFDKYVKMR